jgi:hypothetical protein
MGLKRETRGQVFSFGSSNLTILFSVEYEPRILGFNSHYVGALDGVFEMERLTPIKWWAITSKVETALALRIRPTEVSPVGGVYMYI